MVWRDNFAFVRIEYSEPQGILLFLEIYNCTEYYVSVVAYRFIS
ncbi:hypothetical protein MmTuc01_2272 [Methanosarcina mazei Tuc01]|jgi:hypothetical protein|uniref:Uncharacterized protein n=1 Tax=Methanosarcina mazei Tuc01 TaxID=1236903 RepID=M1Q5I5_METMZ|nr:hypothetical protein MmTuc01_2272 [Methanosarcina mazei Tuc01]